MPYVGEELIVNRSNVILNDNCNSGTLSPKSTKKDDLYNDNCCLISCELLFTEFLDAIAEGEGDRNFRCCKRFFPHFTNDSGSTKYAVEAFYYALQVNSLLTHHQGYTSMWNRSVKGKGSNVTLSMTRRS